MTIYTNKYVYVAYNFVLYVYNIINNEVCHVCIAS